MTRTRLTVWGVMAGAALLFFIIIFFMAQREQELRNASELRMADTLAQQEVEIKSCRDAVKAQEVEVLECRSRADAAAELKSKELRKSLSKILNIESQYKHVDSSLEEAEMLQLLEQRAEDRQEALAGAIQASKKRRVYKPHYWGLVDPMLAAMAAKDYTTAKQLAETIIKKDDASARPYHYAGKILRQLSELQIIEFDVTPQFLRTLSMRAYKKGLKKYPENANLLGGSAYVSLLDARASPENAKTIARAALPSAKQAAAKAPERNQWYYLTINLYRILRNGGSTAEQMSVLKQTIDFGCEAKGEDGGRRKTCAIMVDKLAHLYKREQKYKLAGENFCRASRVYEESETFQKNCRHAKNKRWVE